MSAQASRRRTPALAAIAVGSNLGDRDAHLCHAVERLRQHLTGLRLSSVYETAPVGTPDRQPSFLNAVIVGRTTLAPRPLLDHLLEIERERGRVRTVPGAARTLDLDLILLGDEVVETARLTLPHPRFRTRRFVLEPLAELAPELVDPVTGRSVRELLAQLPTDP